MSGGVFYVGLVEDSLKDRKYSVLSRDIIWFCLVLRLVFPLYGKNSKWLELRVLGVDIWWGEGNVHDGWEDVVNGENISGVVYDCGLWGENQRYNVWYVGIWVVKGKSYVFFLYIINIDIQMSLCASRLILYFISLKKKSYICFEMLEVESSS